jgi:O-antigen/teichoic acid export membrane protein
MPQHLVQHIKTVFSGHPHIGDAHKKVVGNTGWLFADNILRMGIGFLIGIYTTRYLGPEQFGLLSYAISFVTIFSTLAQLGLNGIAVRELVHTTTKQNEILGSTFTLRLLGSIAAILLALLTITAMHPHDRQMCWLVGITSLGLFFQSLGVIDYWFQSQVTSKYSAMARMSAFLISAAARIALIAMKAPLITFAWVGTAEILICSLGFVIAYKNQGESIRNWRATSLTALSLLKSSWPLILAEFVMIIYMRIDKIMLGDISGHTELGIYAVAALLAESFSLIPRSLASSIYPLMLSASHSNEHLFHERMQKIFNLMVLCGYAIAIPVTLTASWAVPFFFGSAYEKAASMLVGLVWTGVFINLGIARSDYLTAMNWTRLHFIVDLIGCIANISLNLILIPKYGGMGAVISAMAGYWLAAHGTCFLFKPLRKTGRMMTKALFYPKIW